MCSAATAPPSPLRQAASAALQGGIPGMAAMATQVTTLMWLRTTMNYQYRYGGTMNHAMRTLYAQGGIPRFYAGYPAALVQGPLSRFGDTAANAGVLALMQPTQLPIAVQTAAASTTAALFRIALMPIDTVKTVFQVEGTSHGLATLRQKFRTGGPSIFFHGAMAQSAATLAGHYPWYTVYNYLNAYLPQYSYKDNLAAHLSRSAFIGFCATLTSDTISNSLRVIKTARQASPAHATYSSITRDILRTEGPTGLLGRGLKTRLLTNAIQGVMFSVLWRLGQDYYAHASKK